LAFSGNAKFVSEFSRVPAFRDRVLLAVPKDMAPRSTLASALSADQVVRGGQLGGDCPLADLRDFRALEYLLLSGSNLHERAMTFFQEAGIAPQIRIKLEVGQLVTAYRLAASGMGAAFVSDRLIRVSPDDRLCYYKLAGCRIERQFYMLLPKREYVPAAVHAFIDWFTAAMKDE
ncbi:MAG: LysR family transcriptional regulator substrate-binding protein, partial [Pyramidobacter sp.]|nr:LysR family transcriptional regulator substrate-binding protein [Pyramidobacter sp.]